MHEKTGAFEGGKIKNIHILNVYKGTFKMWNVV